MMNPSAPKRSDVSDMEQAPTPRASTKQHMSSSNNVRAPAAARARLPVLAAGRVHA
jgi:hypothetical protein